MEDDLYSILIGGAPSALDQQRSVADQLRRRRSFGELAALTGDRALQPFGQSLMRQSDDYAASIQDTRQRDADNAQTRAYQTGQLEHMENVLKETMRNNNMDYKLGMAQILAQLEAAGIRAAAKGGTPRKMTDNTRNSILATVDAYTGTENLLNTFKPEYTQKLGGGPQSRLPNTMARLGLGTGKMDEAQNWWAGWNEIRTLPERNRLFGATLTQNEKSEWDKVDINPSMDKDQIQAGIKRIQSILQRHAKNRVRGMKAEGFDPEALHDYYQDVLPDGDETAVPGSGASGSWDKPDGSDELTPEEQARLEFLRKKHGR